MNENVNLGVRIEFQMYKQHLSFVIGSGTGTLGSNSVWSVIKVLLFQFCATTDM